MSVVFCPTCGRKRLSRHKCPTCEKPSQARPHRLPAAVKYVGLLLLGSGVGLAVAAAGARLFAQRQASAQELHQRLRAVARPFVQAEELLRREQHRLREEAARLRFYNQQEKASDCIERAHTRAADRRVLARWGVIAVAQAAGPAALTAQGRDGVARAINEEQASHEGSDGEPLSGFLVEQILADTRATQGGEQWRHAAGTILPFLPSTLGAELRHLISEHGVQEHCTDGR